MQEDRSRELDVLIVGAGFAGLRMLYEAQRRGLSARVLDAASGVGGTWFYNRYPATRNGSPQRVHGSRRESLC